MKHLLLILLTVLLQVGSHAQQDTLIGTSADDIPHGILGTLDGGYIIYGRTEGSGQGQADFMLVKFDVNEEVLWSYTYGSSGIENGHAIGLNEVSSGDLYLTGNWEQNTGSQDRASILKLNSNGDILWKRLLVGNGAISADTFHEVKEMDDGNLLVAGWSQSFSTGNQDPCVLKITPTGAFLDGIAFGGSLQDHGFNLELESDGFYLMHSGKSDGPGDRAAGLAYLDYDLNILWNKMYGQSDEEAFSDIVPLSASTFLTTGRTESFGPERGFLMQLSDQGDIDWVKTVNAGAGSERICDVQLLADQSYLVTISSTTVDRAVIARFSSTHELQWAKMNPQGTGGSAVFRAEGLMLRADGLVNSVLGIEGIGSGNTDIELLTFNPDSGPCGWVEVVLEIEDVTFLTEDVVPNEIVGGGLTDIFLTRNDLTMEGESIYCEEEECLLEGEFSLETACLGAELEFNYILDVLPIHGLNWEWTINAVVYTDSVPTVTISDPGNLDISLVLSNDSILDCVMLLDTIIPVITIPDFEVIGPDFVCEGDEALYEVTIASVDLTWMNSSTDDEIFITVLTDTLVQVFVDVQGCIDSAQLAVTVDQMPMGTISGPVLLCSVDQVVEYTVDATDYTSILWNNGGTGLNSNYLVNQDTLITVELINGLCTSEDQLAVQTIVIPDFTIDAPSLVCEGDEVEISLSVDAGDLTWMNGYEGDILSITLTMDTLIQVYVDVQGCLDSAEVLVSVDDLPTGDLVGDQLVCPGELLTYSIDALGQQTILWNNGGTGLTSQYVIAQDTVVSLELVNGVCLVQEFLAVQIIPEIDVELSSPSILCIGTEHKLLATGGLDYLWSTGETGESIIVVLDQDTTVWVESTNGCMTDSASVDIAIIDSQASAIDDVHVELEYDNAEVVDFPGDIPFDLIDPLGTLLCNDCFEYVFDLTGNESYTLSHVDQYGCLTEIPFFLSPAPCTEVYMPNSFSPNDDQVNDHFRPVCYEPCIDFYHLRVFDRLGTVVFESFDISEKWSGAGAVSSNYYSANQVYSYRLLYSLADSFDVLEKLGTVAVIR